MVNEVLQKILNEKTITTNDKITFRTIFDVISALFTDENNVSQLTGYYLVNDHQQVWFPNITPNHKREESIENGYANYMSEDLNYIYQFDGHKDIEKRKKLGSKYIHDKIQLIIFAKFIEKSKEKGYHFVGVFTFDSYANEDCKTMIYKKISNVYQLKK